MDVEIEEVSKLLFPDEIPDLWKDSEEFSKYVVHLSSCGVEKLGKEGAHLREERLAILDQTRDLAYTNYKTFIHTADCSRTIFKDFTSVETHLEELSSSLPNMRLNVDQFLATSRNLSQSRHLTSLTLTKHTQLLEVLELPQLMDTCVRNGYYDEALEILAYVRRLERKHTDISIIAGIVTEIQNGTRLMLNQLLSQLRSPLALPQCLKVIGLLRRLDVFTEPELRLKFLQARDAWFTGILKAIPKEDPYQHIIKVVEASRVHLFDIVTQYRAIFSDDDTRFSLGDPEVNEQAIFHGWILHKVNNFIKLVEKDLERGVGPNLENVLAQCMFFGQSFSRIGADFRNLLIPLFQKAALVQFERDVRVANLKFDETLSSFSLMEAPQMSSPSVFAIETQDKTRPPLSLMEFPPLAHYVNSLVAAFNTLRQCCPVSSLPKVMKLLEQSLIKVIGALLELHRLESSGFTAKEEASFQRLCGVVAEGVLPHVNTCLHLLYPLQHISLITGETVAKLQRENFGQLDIEELLTPIMDMLPKKEDEFITTNEDLQLVMASLQESTESAAASLLESTESSEGLWMHTISEEDNQESNDLQESTESAAASLQESTESAAASLQESTESAAASLQESTESAAASLQESTESSEGLWMHTISEEAKQESNDLQSSDERPQSSDECPQSTEKDDDKCNNDAVITESQVSQENTCSVPDQIRMDDPSNSETTLITESKIMLQDNTIVSDDIASQDINIVPTTTVEQEVASAIESVVQDEASACQEQGLQDAQSEVMSNTNFPLAIRRQDSIPIFELDANEEETDQDSNAMSEIPL